MAKPKRQDLPDLSDLACPGTVIAVRATPRAASDGVVRHSDQILIRVTAQPADGEANDAIRKLLARAMGVAPSRLTLVRGQSSRDKQFRYD